MLASALRWPESVARLPQSCYREDTVHLPDGFLSTPVWVALDAAAIPAVGYVVRRAQAGFDEARVPLLGVMGAFVFAAQMINFPVGAGTTGHLVGGALLAYTLGPAAASRGDGRDSGDSGAGLSGWRDTRARVERREHGDLRGAGGISAVSSLGQWSARRKLAIFAGDFFRCW